MARRGSHPCCPVGYSVSLFAACHFPPSSHPSPCLPSPHSGSCEVCNGDTRRETFACYINSLTGTCSLLVTIVRSWSADIRARLGAFLAAIPGRVAHVAARHEALALRPKDVRIQKWFYVVRGHILNTNTLTNDVTERTIYCRLELFCAEKYLRKCLETLMGKFSQKFITTIIVI